MSDPFAPDGAGLVDLDEAQMREIQGGGGLSEFVYDTVHTVVSIVRYAYLLRPEYGPGKAGYASAKAG